MTIALSNLIHFQLILLFKTRFIEKISDNVERIQTMGLPIISASKYFWSVTKYSDAKFST